MLTSRVGLKLIARRNRYYYNNNKDEIKAISTPYSQLYSSKLRGGKFDAFAFHLEAVITDLEGVACGYF